MSPAVPQRSMPLICGDGQLTARFKRAMGINGRGQKYRHEACPTPFDTYKVPSGEELPWYRPDEEVMDILPPETYKLLSRRLGLNEAALKALILDIRRQAWQYGHYPAIGGFRFLRPTIRKHPLYKDMLKALKQGAILLELGPGLGQDLQYLIADGAPSNRMYTVDVRPELWKLGQQLFGLDHDDTKGGPHFLRHELVNESDWAKDFVEKHGQVNFIMANQFFDTQSDPSIVMIRRWLWPLLAPGCVLMGYQMAAEQSLNYNDEIFFISEALWRQDWRTIGSVNDTPHPPSMELELLIPVALKEWGLRPREWEWPGEGNLHGVYFAARRVQAEDE